MWVAAVMVLVIKSHNKFWTGGKNDFFVIIFKKKLTKQLIVERQENIEIE